MVRTLPAMIVAKVLAVTIAATYVAIAMNTIATDARAMPAAVLEPSVSSARIMSASAPVP